jgi:PTH1 family peptidyl-tRNA hydrolase
LVVGLGNPGGEYAATRHNVGFMVLDEIARRCDVTTWKKKDAALQAIGVERRVVFVKPVSFMNLSGTPVRLISSWYRTPPEGVLVISDDMDLPFGKLRMRGAGGHGGHNGLRSIIATIGEGFPRLRVGVGRPAFDSIDHVLGTFNDNERKVLPEVVDAATQGALLWIDDGLEAAMRYVNGWRSTDTEPESG